MDLEKFRTKVAAILEKTAYQGLHTFAREHFINDVVNAAKQCEEPTTTPASLVESEEGEEEEENEDG